MLILKEKVILALDNYLIEHPIDWYNDFTYNESKGAYKAILRIKSIIENLEGD